MRALLADRARPVGPARPLPDRRARRGAPALQRRARRPGARGHDRPRGRAARRGAALGPRPALGRRPGQARPEAHQRALGDDGREARVPRRVRAPPLPGRRRRLLRVGEAPGRHDAAVVGHAPRRRAVRVRRAVGDVARAPGRRAAAHLHDRHDARERASSRTSTTACRSCSRRTPRRRGSTTATPPADLQELCAPLEETGHARRRHAPSTTPATTAPTASSPRPRRSRSSSAAPCSRASRRPRSTPARPGSTSAAAAAGRRCCSCTATRRRTSCGTRSRRRSPRTSPSSLTDLRGYGESSSRRRPPDHGPYSKRAMARDQVARDARARASSASPSCGHDRGGRVGYRMALDHPERVDAPRGARHRPDRRGRSCAPTARSAWATGTGSSSPSPRRLPERMIGADPDAYYRHFDADFFDPEAVAEYRRARRRPRRRSTRCARTTAPAPALDVEHDLADRDHRRRIACPLLALWGGRWYLEDWYDVLGDLARVGRRRHAAARSTPGTTSPRSARTTSSTTLRGFFATTRS